MFREVGILIFSIGLIMFLSAWKVTKRYDIFLFEMIFGPLFIYYGLQLLNR